MSWAKDKWPDTVPTHDWGPHSTVLLESSLGIAAVVVYNNYQPACSIDIHCASAGGKWLTRPFLAAVFRYPFEQLKVRRVTARIGADNPGAERFLRHLGFMHEGTIRKAWGPNTDLLVFGLLKDECRFLGDSCHRKAQLSNPARPQCSGIGADRIQ